MQAFQNKLLSTQSHGTTRRLLCLLNAFFEHIQLPKSDVTRLLEETHEAPLAPTTLRKYMRTFKLAGYSIRRHRHCSEILYTLIESNHTYMALVVQHEQAMEELMAVLAPHSRLIKKLGLLLPRQNMELGQRRSIFHFGTSAYPHHLGNMFHTLSRAIEQKQTLGFTLQKQAGEASHIQLWGMPYMCVSIGPRDAVVSCIHPQDKYIFHVRLSRIHGLEPFTIEAGTLWWQQAGSYTIHLPEQVVKRYEPKEYESKISCNAWDVKYYQPFLSILKRCLKYGPETGVSQCPMMERKLGEFHGLQREILRNAAEQSSLV